MPWESYRKPEDCPTPDHDWIEDCRDPANEDDVGHPALSAEGVRHPSALEDEPVMFWTCRHCDAWKRMTDENTNDELGNEEFDNGNGGFRLLPGGKAEEE